MINSSGLCYVALKCLLICLRHFKTFLPFLPITYTLWRYWWVKLPIITFAFFFHIHICISKYWRFLTCENKRHVMLIFLTCLIPGPYMQEHLDITKDKFTKPVRLLVSGMHVKDIILSPKLIKWTYYIRCERGGWILDF